MPTRIIVEVVFAGTDSQELQSVELAAGATVYDAIEISGVLRGCDDEIRRKLSFGIWGRVVAPDRVLRNADRVEVYRPLRIEPREARRRLAEVGQTMRGKSIA